MSAPTTKEAPTSAELRKLAASTQEVYERQCSEAFVAGLKEVVGLFPEIKTISFMAQYQSDDEGGSYLSTWNYFNKKEEQAGELDVADEQERLKTIDVSRWALENLIGELAPDVDSAAKAIKLEVGDSVVLTRAEILEL